MRSFSVRRFLRVIWNLLAVVGIVSLLLVGHILLWLYSPWGAASLEIEESVNPERSRVADIDLKPDDRIVFQDERYDGFFGDGGGVVVASLSSPGSFAPPAWVAISELPAEFRDLLTSRDVGSEHVQAMLAERSTLWSLSRLQRNGGTISNLVIFLYDPVSKTILEWIKHT